MAQYIQYNIPRSSVGDIVATHATDSTTVSFAAKVPTTTMPSGDGVIVMSVDGSAAQVGVVLQPYADANDVTFSLRLWAWRQGSLFGTLYYVPQMLIEVDCVAGNIAAGFAASRYLCDDLTVVAGDSTANADSPANDTPGGVMAHAWGARFIEVELAINSGSAAHMNCLVRPHSS